MKFVFKDLGEKKISKTVELIIPPGTGFQTMGFVDVMDFMVCEAAPYFPDDEKLLEAVACDGLPELLASRYVMVYNGIHQRGTVDIFP